MQRRPLGIALTLSVGFVFAVFLTSCSREEPGTRSTLDQQPWQAWKSRFLSAEGRVIDDGQGGISHSEGQGYALVLATAFDDREAFDRVWQWARTELRVRDDSLMGWRWDPASESVTDSNNATDGDLLVAWGLLRGARLWDDPALREEAMRIASDLERKVVRDSPDGPLLLPGERGFDKPEGPIVNLSYWVYPAMHELERARGGGLWSALSETGLALTERARFGSPGLPPDWLQVGDELRPAPLFPPRSGYDAVRIPLYLTWDGKAYGELMKPHRRWWAEASETDVLPAWIDLETGETGEPAPRGFRAVKALGTVADPVLAASPREDESYYSATLTLLAHVAHHERGRP